MIDTTNDHAPGDTDPMATTVTPLQREAVIRDLIREARDGAISRNTSMLINWLWAQIPDAAPGDTAGERRA